MLNNPSIEQPGQGIQMFTNPSFGLIRTAGTADSPLFNLADVCKAIGIKRPAVVKSRLDEGDVCLIDTPTESGIQQMNYVTEPGLYDVIIRSDASQARPFRKWITSDVLPTIRKTGGYIHQEEGDTDADIMAKALMIAQKTIDDKKQRIQMLEGENSYLQKENALMAPKAQYTDEVLQSTATLTFTEVAKELNFRSAVSLIQRLVKDHIIYKQSNRYLPYARYSGVGYFASRTHRFFHSDGRPGVEVSTVVTQKGRHFLHEYFKVQMEPMSVELFNE